jgi:formamidopyrimidine-DNA glycosylase
MPELPEVETIKNDLRPLLVGRTIVGATLDWGGAVGRPSPEEFMRQVVGRRIEDVQRRGKLLVFALSGGKSLLVHLRMTGQLLVGNSASPRQVHIRASLQLENGHELRFVDVRKFGRLYLVDDPQEVLGDLGPEPLADDFRVDDFCGLCSKRRGMIKPLLLNQRFLAGLGNIYADEALFHACIDPRRKADTLSREELSGLHCAIRKVLRHGIEDGGTTLTDYARPDGRGGTHQERLLVFRREAEPCPRCGTTIERIVVGGRGTFICPRCQEAPPPIG